MMTPLENILSSYHWFDHIEGMKFVETHRDSFRTSGHWLFLPKAISSFHKVTNTSELWYIHQGRLILHILAPDGSHQQVLLGTDLQAGEHPAVEIPATCWQAAELPEGEPFAFGTNVCAPAFSYNSFLAADQDSLLRTYPAYSDIILRLTPDRMNGHSTPITIEDKPMIYHLVAEQEFIHQAHKESYLPIHFQDCGFVHCAFEPSVLAVANDFYSNLPDTLLLLRIDTDRMTAETKYEAASPEPGAGIQHQQTSETFPHVYGAINTDAIDGIGRLGKGTDGYLWPDIFITLSEYLQDHGRH